MGMSRRSEARHLSLRIRNAPYSSGAL
jgi:hypothetical protein